MSERYSWQEIWDKTTSDLTLGNEDLREVVVDVLSLVLKELADSVMDGCLFLMLEYRPQCIPNYALEDKWLIALPENFLRGELRQSVLSLFHEIAHFHLKHDSRTTARSREDMKRQEAEAASTAEQWMKDAEQAIQEHIAVESTASESMRQARGIYRTFVEGNPNPL